MTVVLKLGGSVLTEKDTPETVDEDALAIVTEAIGTALEAQAGPERLVVVHGGGSFGHHHAHRHGVNEQSGTHDATAVTEVHGAMAQLNDAVVAALHADGVEAVPVGPLSVAHRDEDGVLSVPCGGIETMLAENFVPVVYGDVIPHAGAGATILSGDDIVVSLAESLDADRVGLCSAVPGVLDSDGTVVARIDALSEVAAALDGVDGTDVTGGMAAKVEKLLDLGVPAHIFEATDVEAFLAGENPGTAVLGES